ncbi:dermonecrotic toxin domain-containing protein [Pseudomonas sp. CAM1A]|uniref:dermonecrotic toxin domain-containing protein n=1 Tax=Pseudomonas sp. CAM1A TaxID=3231717 RepID=UPI0039C69D63
MLFSSHLSVIPQRHPDWHRQASPGQRAYLRQRVLASYRASRNVAQALKPVKAIDAFCRPLLETALAHWFPGAALPALDDAVLWNVAEGRQMPWLEAALQNFEAHAKVRLYRAGHTNHQLPLDSARFVSGVRNLDLGQRYLDHLGAQVDTDVFRALLRRQDRAAFAAELTEARLRGRIDSRGECLGEVVLSGACALTFDDGVRHVQCGYLSLFGIPLGGPLLVRLEPVQAQEPCLLYLPGHAQAIRQYPSLQALGQALTEALWQHQERAFFSRYVSQAQQAQFVSRLRATLYPRYPYAGLQAGPLVLEKGQRFDWLNRMFPSPTDLWQETLDKNARLPMTFTPWPGNAFEARARTQVQRQLADAACLAVPVAQRDATALRTRIEGWLGLGMTVLNIAAFFVPMLGEVMMVIGGAQLVGAFLDGVHAANEGDVEGAIAHLFDVLENLAQVAALGAAGVTAQRQGLLHEWIPVERAGQRRLWQGDLTPFTRPRPWPAGARAGRDGLFHWNAKHWLQHDGQAFPLEPAGKGGWRLAKARGVQHRPVLHGDGYWLLDHEQPLGWNEQQLLERAWPAGAGLEPQARALRCSGYDSAVIRRALTNRRALPALLADSFEAFSGQAGEGQASALPGSEVLSRDFPGLSPRACNEILAEAAPTDLSRLATLSRVPLAIAEKARLYLREIRINKALARLHLETGSALDRDALVFRALERLPGWSGEVRLELWENGQLQEAAGKPGQSVKSLWRSSARYEPRDQQGQPLASAGDLFQAILQALPDSERQALGLQIHDAARLRETLFELAAGNRRQTALDLGMAPVRPLYRLPTRLPGNGRLGYRLSGHGRHGWLSADELFDQLYPSTQEGDRELLRTALRQQAGPRPGAFTQLLERLRAEYSQLDESLRRWVHDADGIEVGGLEQRRVHRGVMAERIRTAWRRDNPPDTLANFDYVVLLVHGLHVGDLPTLPVQLPHVRQLTVNGLAGGESTNLNGFLHAFPQARYLDLSENALSGLPPFLGELSALETLDLSENRLDLDGDDALATLARLTRLVHLNLTAAIDTLSVRTLEQLGRLPALSTLQADVNELELGAAHFLALQRWPSLRVLLLGQNQIELDEAARTALAGLNRLSRLSLSENPLELAPDVSGWTALEELDLESTGIVEWPAGLQQLLEQHPLALRELDLSRNGLTEAPDLTGSSFASAIRAGETDLFYSFLGNPFTDAALERLNSAGLDTPAYAGPPPQWSEDWPQVLLDHIAETAPEPQWAPLYELFQRLPDTVDFQRNPAALRQRMQQVLQILVDAQAPGDTWGQAQLQQQINDLLNDAGQACVDQTSLLFQQVETEVIVWRAASRANPGTADEQVAVGCARGMLRQHLLDARVGDLYNARLARRQALREGQAAVPPLLAGDDISDASLSEADYLLDEVEMALHARMHLRDALGLPPQPQDIAFDYLARMSEGTLQGLANTVQAASDGPHLVDWVVDQPFWRAWLQRLQPQAFEQFEHTWAGASEYFDTLSEASTTFGAYVGSTVPPIFVQALEREVPELTWRIEGVLQRIDLVSNRYANESALYQRIAALLLNSRDGARQTLLRQLTTTMVQANPR